MSDLALLTHLEAIYGIDISFDAQFGRQGTKDAVPNLGDTDFIYVAAATALAEELQRLFDLTERGDFLDDPDYGIRWDRLIGVANNPDVTIAIAKYEILRALQHPSFVDRFRVRYLDVQFDPSEPNALRTGGVLECYGFGVPELARFGYFTVKAV